MKKLWFFVPLLVLLILAGGWFFFLREKVIIAPDYEAISRESQKALPYLPDEGEVFLSAKSSGQGRKKGLGLFADPGLSLRAEGQVSNRKAQIDIDLSAGKGSSSWSLVEDDKIFLKIKDETYDTRKKGAEFINPIPFMRPELLLSLWPDLPERSLEAERDGEYYKYRVKPSFYKEIQKIWPGNFLLLELEKNIKEVWVIFTKDSLPAGIKLSYKAKSSDLSRLLGLGQRSREIEEINLELLYLVRSFEKQAYPGVGSSQNVARGEKALGAELIGFYSGLQ